MKLVIMTKPTFFVEEDKILATLFEEGMDALHLRKSGSSPLYSERLLSLLPETSYRKITVHDHFYLKEEYGLSGIHLDSDASEAPEGYRGHVSRTCSDLSRLKDMKRNSAYVFLDGVFSSSEGTSGGVSFTHQELENAAEQGLIDKKVMALGCDSPERIRMAKELGFGGVVVCSDLWDRFDIHYGCDFSELINHFERLRKSIG